MDTFVTIPKESDFSLDNLPYGIFSLAGEGRRRMGVAIGEEILDLSVLAQLNCFPGPELAKNNAIFQKDVVNDLMGLGPSGWSETRETLQKLLSSRQGFLRDNLSLQKQLFVLQKDVTMHLPAKIGCFTDFSASKKHAENDRIMFTDKNQQIMSNWNYIPVAYHSRASSVVISGTPIRRPHGQIPSPEYVPSERLDFELELGALVGGGNQLGQPIALSSAEQHIFGMLLLNDWSARDIQAWEWEPLGPFLCKSFATSVSPWVVSMEALGPFSIPASKQFPEALEYLKEQNPMTYDIHLEVHLQGSSNADRNPLDSDTCTLLTQSNYKYMYWTLKQQLAHHTSNGCNLTCGDLIGTGTISGPTLDSSGSLSELSQRGNKPVTLLNGQTRSFLNDGDQVTFRGWCSKDGIRVGFGNCSGQILPAHPSLSVFD